MHTSHISTLRTISISIIFTFTALFFGIVQFTGATEVEQEAEALVPAMVNEVITVEDETVSPAHEDVLIPIENAQCSDTISDEEDGVVDADDWQCEVSIDDTPSSMMRTMTAPMSAMFTVAPSMFEATLESLNSQNFPYVYLNTRITDGGTQSVDLTVSDFVCTENGTVQTDSFDVTPPQTGGNVRLADVVFLIDTSGSMGSAINGVKTNVTAFAQALSQSNIDFRLGLVQFGQSSNSGNPRIFNGGNLTADATEFGGFVSTLSATGGIEPGFAALRTATQSFNFRPGAQKVFLIITDEDSDDRDKVGTIALMQTNDIVVHTAALCSSGLSNGDYCDDTSVRAATGGLLFSVQGPYSSILDSIVAQAAATYVVRYKSSNPAFDGTERVVECTITHNSDQTTIQDSYIPGSAPKITLSPQTELLNETTLEENSLFATVRVLVVDDVTPFVSANGVRLYYRTTGAGAYSSLVMTESGGYYEATIPVVKKYGVDYYITATDGQQTSSLPSTDPGVTPFNIAVLPNVAPVISHTPVTGVAPNQAIVISANITDTTNAVVSAELHYRRAGELLYTPLLMQKTTGDVYEASIPAGVGTSDIEYYLYVKDNYGVSAFKGTKDVPFVITVSGAGNAPTLQYVAGDVYADDVVAEGRGVHPNKGVANEDDLLFKVQYTDESAPQDVTLHIQQLIDFTSDYFLQTPYITSEAIEHVHRANHVRPNLPNDVLGYEGALGYRPGFDEDESITFTPGGRAKGGASVEFYVTRISGGFGPEFLTVALEALDASGAVVAREEKKVDVSDIADYASVLETLYVSSNNGDIKSIRYSITDASFSLTFDAEAWIKSISFDEVVPMTKESVEGADYAKGMTYTATSRFPKGKYSYYFTTADADNLMDRLPETGTLSFTTGYSSVVFLHGIEASRLYLGENKVWLPNRGSGGGTSGEEDIKKTAFGAQGESVNDLYTKDEDILNTAYGVNKVYDEFSMFMDNLEKDGVIHAWKPIAYDWRLDYFDILQSGVKRNDVNISYLDQLPEGKVPYVIDEIQKLAVMSDTGKVTIITHSNGGLLAKTLLSEVEKESNSYHGLYAQVDKLVMVAPPQLGTPQAYASMLHGGGHPFESFSGGIAAGFNSNVDQAWRFASRNMPMAYDLLPSKKYTELMLDNSANKLVVFDTSLDGLATTLDARSNGFQGGGIEMAYDYRRNKTGTVNLTGYDEYTDFLLGTEGRPAPTYQDIRHPEKLQRELLEGVRGAEETHAHIDTWIPADLDGDGKPDIEVIQIAGWGNETVSGIRYELEQDVYFSCLPNNSVCNDFPGVRMVPIRSSKGDQTVILQSAVPMPVETWYVDLSTYNSKAEQKKHGDSTNRQHANIMGAKPTLSLLGNIIQSRSQEVAYTSKRVPTGAHIVQLEMHSPVALHVYNAEGNHTGPVTDSDGVTYFENAIPGSSIIRFGESVYISLHADEVYQVRLDGVGQGTFTFKIQEKIDDALLGERVYKDIPVQESTTGAISVGAISQTGSLTIDYQGDGKNDFTLGANGGTISPFEYLKMLEISISNMSIQRPAKAQLLGHITAIRALLTAEQRLPAKNVTARTQIKKQVVALLNALDSTQQQLANKGQISRADGRIIHRLIGNVREGVVE